MQQLPKERRVEFTNAAILHGGKICTARNLAGGRRPLFEVCEWPEKAKHAGQMSR